jgi:hypothetical protein
MAHGATKAPQVTSETEPDRRDEGIVRALGPHLGVALYDPIVAVVMRERLFRDHLVAQVLADAPPERPLDVVELGCGTPVSCRRCSPRRGSPTS